MSELYESFIKQVYIDPIRSVLAVDDEFPTLYEYVEDEKIEKKGKDHLKNIINLCHDNSRNWMLDVHDGLKVDFEKETSSIRRLHQSDLLILDYHLEGDDDDSTKSLKIIDSVAHNDHFNIIMVYTTGTISEAFSQILTSILSPWNELCGDDPDKSIVEKWDDEFDGDVLKALKSTIGLSTYLRLRHTGILQVGANGADAYLGSFETSFDKIKKIGSTSIDDCLKWILRNIEVDFGIHEHDEYSVRWDFGEGEAKNWLRTDKLFLTVVSKKQEVLIDELIGALKCWNPSPNRLIATKMRNELSKRGVSAEDKALTDHIMQCGWLEDLKSADEDQNRIEILQMIERNSSGIIGALQNEVISFSKNVLTHLKEGDLKSHDFFNIEEFNGSVKHIARLKQNAHVCSMRPIGHHLTTGHILQLKEEYWVCLTQSCELVPTQNRKKARFIAVAPAMPINCCKLHPIDLTDTSSNKKKLVEYIKSNRCVFLNIDNSIKGFHFHPDKTIKSDPEWESMLAADLGRFDGEKFVLEIGRLAQEAKEAKEAQEAKEAKEAKEAEEAQEAEKTKPDLSIFWQEATIVSQLRYEYAINLMNALGNSMTRVGLDFIR